MSQTLQVFLTQIIDYAGLFPPSQVTMAIAVQNFAAYQKSEYSWMLGRFIVPVGRLDEFSKEAESHLTEGKPWQLSVLASENLAETLEKVNEFNLQNEGKAQIDTLEIKVENAESIKESAKIIPPGITAYYEFPPDEILADFISSFVFALNAGL